MKVGFTLVELILVMGILAALFGIAGIGFFGTQGKYLNVQGVDILVADLRSQQTKAMTGSVPQSGTEQAGYGIHFGTDTYTLFDGTVYNSAAGTNVVVQLPDGITFTANNWDGGNVIFLRGSGQVKDFVTGQDYVELTSAAGGEARRVRLNRLGVVVEGI